MYRGRVMSIVNGPQAHKQTTWQKRLQQKSKREMSSPEWFPIFIQATKRRKL